MSMPEAAAAAAPPVAEPTAAPEAAAEPTAPEPAAEPTAPEPAAEPAPEPAPPEVTVESFGWDDWDGQSYDGFPEEVRPWMEHVGGRHGEAMTTLQKQLTAAQASLQSWEGNFSDPRVTELTTANDTLTQEKAILEKRIADMEQAHAQTLEAQDKQYVDWLSNDPGYMAKVEQVKTTLGDTAEGKLDALIEAGFPLHVAIDVAIMGAEAADQAAKWGPMLTQPGGEQLVMDALKGRYGQAPAPPKPEPKASPMANLVNGAERGGPAKNPPKSKPAVGENGRPLSTAERIAAKYA